MTTIPNPMDTQREELAVARIARDMALNELEEIATALYVRANISVTTNVADAVNKLLDSWEEMYAEKAKVFRQESEQRLNELHERLKEHKASLVRPDELRKYFGGEDGN